MADAAVAAARAALRPSTAAAAASGRERATRGRPSTRGFAAKPKKEALKSSAKKATTAAVMKKAARKSPAAVPAKDTTSLRAAKKTETKKAATAAVDPAVAEVPSHGMTERTAPKVSSAEAANLDWNTLVQSLDPSMKTLLPGQLVYARLFGEMSLN